MRHSHFAFLWRITVRDGYTASTPVPPRVGLRICVMIDALGASEVHHSSIYFTSCVNQNVFAQVSVQALADCGSSSVSLNSCVTFMFAFKASYGDT